MSVINAFKIFDFFSSHSLSRRDEAQRLFLALSKIAFIREYKMTTYNSIDNQNVIDNCRINKFEVFLDFSNINYVSRSFVDEFVKVNLDLHHTFQIDVKICNAIESIEKSIEVVSKTQIPSKKIDNNEIDTIAFNSIVKFHRYMESID